MLGLSRREFWCMTPIEFGAMVEGKMPQKDKPKTSLTRKDVDRMVEREKEFNERMRAKKRGGN